MNDATLSDSAAPHWLSDLIAGVSIAGLVVPEAIAYAGIAGMPARSGLIALLAGLLCYGLVGRSRFAIVSPTSSSAAVLLAVATNFSLTGPAAHLALAAGLILLCGLFFILAGIVRLGAASNFIAKPVLRGFTFGLALVIIIRQLPSITGITPLRPDLFSQVVGQLSHWHEWNLAGVVLAAAALLVLYAAASFKRLPAALIVVVAGIMISHFFALASRGVGLVGPIQLQFAAPTLPALPRRDWYRLGELAFALLFIIYAESYGSIRSAALRHGEGFFPNRDLMALGLSNIASGLFQGLPVGAGFSATSANETAGARSRWAAWSAAGTVIAIALTLLPMVALTPEPILAAIVIHAVGRTLRLDTFRPYFQWQRDRFIALAAIIAVLLLGVLDGLLVAVAVSLVMILRELSEPKLSVLGRLGAGPHFVNLGAHPEANPLPGLLILRPEAPLFFANSERIMAQVRTQITQAQGAPLRAVILSLEESPDLDGTAVESIGELASDLHGRQLKLVLARLKEPAIDVLRRAAIPELPPAQQMNWNVAGAVDAALAAG